MSRLAEIKERMEKATHGNWEVYKNKDGVCVGTAGDHPQLNAPYPIITMGIRATEPSRNIWISDENAEFIAHSRGDVEYLLGEIERLQDELNRSARVTFGGRLPVGRERE